MKGRGEAFRLLGVSADATEAEVRDAFRRKVMESHPDTAADGTDDTMVRRLIEAYRLLAETAPRTAPDSALGRVGGPGQGARPVELRRAVAEGSQASTRVLRRCSQCRGFGLRLRVVTCPACRGESVVTTLDIERVGVARCGTCVGGGQVRRWVQCDACGGAGEV